MCSSDETAAFTAHRELLFSIVYTMLGSVADTEDVLQETWMSWSGRSSGVGNPRAYLVRIAVNHALARQAQMRRRRETYVGPWLPEPLVTDSSGGEEAVLRAESLSMALLVILESLSPLERAVFVLNEAFGYSHKEIAELLGRSPAAVRQVAHRAREHVQARRPRYKADPRVHQEATEKFLAAGIGGDFDALMELLAPDVTLWADGGGKARAAGLRPIHGREKVARVLVAGFGRPVDGAVSIGYRRVNGDPSALVFSDGAPFMVVVLDLVPGSNAIRGIYAVTNPDKLLHVG